MTGKSSLLALTAVAMLAASSPALAQNAGAAAGAVVAPGTNGVPPVGTPPNGSPGVTTGTGAGSSTGAGINQPGVPNTSTPGVIGTGASPSGLPGDSPTQPGYPGKVGN